jgi:hypothetical protein
VQYYVGEDDDRHMVDHPPLFACECEGRKTLLTLNKSFVEELLATAQDIMPGNPGEIAGVYFKPAEMTFTLHSFLIPPKIVLYNPDQLRGPDALPYTVVLIDKKFFGIPAIYLTPDRFAGCDTLQHMKVRPRQSAQQQSRPRPQSGVKQSGSRRAPQQGGPQRKPGRRPQGAPPKQGAPKGPPRGRPPAGNQRPDQSRRRRPDESGTRGSGGEPARPRRPR